MLHVGALAQPLLTVGLLGCGNIVGQMAEGILAGRAGNVRVVGVLGRGPSERLTALAERLGARPCLALDELLALRPQVVVEAASAEALAQLGPRVLEAGVDLMGLSPACLVDREVERRFEQAAASAGRSLLLPPGSADGIDWLLSARHDLLEPVRVTVTWRVNPEAPPYTGDGEPMEVFRGSAREAGQRYNRVLNFVVAIALAGSGLDDTQVRILLDPREQNTGYVLEARAAWSRLRTEVVLGRPGGKGGWLAGRSALAALRRMSAGAGYNPGRET